MDPKILQGLMKGGGASAVGAVLFYVVMTLRTDFLELRESMHQLNTSIVKMSVVQENLKEKISDLKYRLDSGKL